MVSSNFDEQSSVGNRFRLIARSIGMPPKQYKIIKYLQLKLLNFNQTSVVWLYLGRHTYLDVGINGSTISST